MILPSRGRQVGFTLMELIGVIAIIAILSAVIGPNLFQSIDAALGKAEKSNLAALADGLKSYSQQAKAIPSGNAASWSSVVASQVELPQADVLTNGRGFTRGLYFDPRFLTTSDSNFPGYQQISGLVNAPVSPRAILVSDLTRNAPSAPTNTAAFNAIWDQDPSASVIEGPKVSIQRINFIPMFHRVVLNNQDTNQPAYALEGGPQSAIPAASGGLDGTLTRYVLDGSELRLYRASYPSGPLETSSLVSFDRHYRYATDGTNWYWERP